MEASLFVQTVEHRQGFKIACFEEIAFNNNWLSAEEILQLAKPLKKTGYGKYLELLVKE
jgi:glucose-1-phosphate thymidylyltransferase